VRFPGPGEETDDAEGQGRVACKLIVFGSFNCGSVPVASSTGYHHASQRPLQRGKTWFCLVAD
jgi:hypothetical protein